MRNPRSANEIIRNAPEWPEIARHRAAVRMRLEAKPMPRGTTAPPRSPQLSNYSLFERRDGSAFRSPFLALTVRNVAIVQLAVANGRRRGESAAQRISAAGESFQS